MNSRHESVGNGHTGRLQSFTQIIEGVVDVVPCLGHRIEFFGDPEGFFLIEFLHCDEFRLLGNDLFIFLIQFFLGCIKFRLVFVQLFDDAEQ